MPRRHRTVLSRVSTAASTAALGAGAAAVLHPDRLGIDHRFPFVAAVAWRPQAAVVAVASAALLASGRRTRGAGLVLGAVGLAGLAAVARRALPTRPGPQVTGDELTVLGVNVLLGRADTGELATLIEREHPDFVVLPEAGYDFRDKLMPLVEVLGYRSWVSTPPGVHNGFGVTLLAAARAGDVRVRSASAMRARHLEATGGVLGSRVLYAAHPAAPTRPARAREWRRDLTVLAQWTRRLPAPIVVGDFNSTFDHGPMRAAAGGCRSAADGTGRGLLGTYPSSLPRWFGIQIDHVLVPAGAVTERLEIVDVGGTDHRGVLARVRLPG